MRDQRDIDLGALGLGTVQTGYTGGEWAAASPPPGGEAMNAAHARWGGGKELSYAELEELLALMFTLQVWCAVSLYSRFVQQSNAN